MTGETVGSSSELGVAEAAPDDPNVPDVGVPDRADLEDLPPSAKAVMLALTHERQLTQKGIADATLLSVRTVRYALERLDDVGVLEEEVRLRDPRQKVYSLDIGRRA